MFFSFLGGRFLLYGIAALLITAVVGGFWVYQRSIVSSLENRVQQLTAENEQLKLEIQRKDITIKTLEKMLAKKDEDIKKMIEEIEKNRKIVEESQQRLKSALEKLNDYERKERLQKLLESRKRELILKYMNKNVKCWIENFHRTDGECVQGRWVKRQ